MHHVPLESVSTHCACTKRSRNTALRTFAVDRLCASIVFINVPVVDVLQRQGE